MSVKVAVVGAGAPGLSSALCILQRLPSVEVTVIAEKFNHDTTSAGAAGYVTPYLLDKTYVPNDRNRKWVNDGANWYIPLAEGPESKDAGIMFTSGYQMFKEVQESAKMSNGVRNVRKLTKEELRKFSPDFKDGHFFTTVMVECKYYLPWLMKKIKSMGGKVLEKRIASFEEIADDYDIIVNCAGLANRWLLNDTEITAVRGQVYRVKMPWIKHFVYDASDFYYCYVGREHAIIGGTKASGNVNTKIDPKESKLIWENVSKLVPTLKDAEIDFEWVGLRPYRPTIRVERELKDMGSRRIHMVHNYGHGGNGVALSWGTALEATELVTEIIQNKDALKAKL